MRPDPYTRNLDFDMPSLPLALCADSGEPDAWHPEKNGRANTAKKVCGNCPEMEACLAYAIPRPELSGIWGGTSADERIELRRLARRRAAA